MIELKHLRKAYPNVVPLKDVNAVINDGDIISVIGPSGTGKSTLIRCINMLDRPTSGQIIIDGEDVTDKKCKINDVRKKVGMVFQSFNLFEHMTVIENVMVPPMDLLHMDRKTAYKKAMGILRKVGMDGRAFNYPDMLSGGQKQRVAIARTLAMDPEIILFDEPTSALDPTMVGEVEAVIRDLKKTGKTMMIVTHEMRFAKEICNRVFYMDQGEIYEDGTPEQIFENPQKELTRRFIRHLKVFETNINEESYDFIGTVSEIEKYGYKNQVPSSVIYKIQTVFEEVCQQILLPRFDVPNINFTVEYDSKESTTSVVVSYDGESFDIKDSDNELALSIVSNVCDSIEHAFYEDGTFANVETLIIK